MSDTFTFVAPAMPRRRPEPFTTRLISLALALAVIVAGFATFVVRAERAADARRTALEAQAVAAERAKADRIAVEAEAGLARQQATMTTVPAGVARLLDAQARDAADHVLSLAQGEVADDGDLSSADVAWFTQQDGALLFVDGPSTAPSIVSIAASTTSWGAAVMGPSGTCYLVSLRSNGAIAYDRGATCTGESALGAARVSW
jgi:hypothetical protein